MQTHKYTKELMKMGMATYTDFKIKITRKTHNSGNKL